MKTCHRSLFLFVASTLFAQQATSIRESPFQVIRPAPADLDMLAFRTTVPDFEARDLSGRTWRSADLRGKLTVVQIWGTFCLPCRQEHPALQDFFNKARSANNVQVLTFSVDSDPSRTLSYMKDKGYTFPVIVERALDVKLFPEGGLPESWVIGPDGRRSDAFKSWTFGRVLLEVEKLAMSK
jgi:peroxiredoxin